MYRLLADSKQKLVKVASHFNDLRQRLKKTFIKLDSSDISGLQPLALFFGCQDVCKIFINDVNVFDEWSLLQTNTASVSKQVQVI